MSCDAALSRAEIDRLAEELAETATHIDVATHRLLRQIRAFDASGGWAAQGALSCANWLSWRIGMGLGAAREKVRVAAALGGLPLIDAALERGELSYSKVRAMTRVATAANEELLVTMARATTAAQLERICRLYRPVQVGDREAEEIERDRRHVTSRPTDDGMVAIQIRVLPDEASRILAAIDAHAEGGSQADGAVALAEAGLQAPVGKGGRVRPPVEVVVHVSAEMLAGVTDQGDGIPAETCRRLLCDAGVVPLLEDQAGKTIDVGRKTRTIPAALRRALETRDGGCRFPGCTNRRFVDAHHVQHWIDGGTTDLDNTILLCRRHHRSLHEHGSSLTMVDGTTVFHDPVGRPIDDVPVREPRDPERDRWLVPVGGMGGLPGWDGVPVDYALCVAALAGVDRPGPQAYAIR